MKKGIFWCKDFDTDNPKLITVAAMCDLNGFPNEAVTFSSKSGENFNHKTEWSKLPKSVTQGKLFRLTRIEHRTVSHVPLFMQLCAHRP